MDFKKIIDKSVMEPINSEEALFLLRECEQHEKALLLYEAASKVREQEMGNVFHWYAGIKSISNCTLSPHCLYCNFHQTAKLVTKEKVINRLTLIRQHGIRRFWLVGGCSTDGKDALRAVTWVHDFGYDGLIFNINVGPVPIPMLKQLKALGIRRIDCAFESINPKFYQTYKPGDNLKARKQFAVAVGDAGIKLGTTLLCGIGPKETRYQDYVDLIFYIKNFKHLEHLKVSIFTPRDSPMASYPKCSPWEGACVIAIARLILRNINISHGGGWWDSDGYPTPLMAGTGDSVLIPSAVADRTPYSDIMRKHRESYEKLGLDIEP